MSGFRTVFFVTFAVIVSAANQSAYYATADEPVVFAQAVTTISMPFAAGGAGVLGGSGKFVIAQGTTLDKIEFVWVQDGVNPPQTTTVAATVNANDGTWESLGNKVLPGKYKVYANLTTTTGNTTSTISSNATIVKVTQ